MNAQAILQKIEDDAQQGALKLKDDAASKARQMKDAAQQAFARLRDETVEKANAECEALTQRMRRMAELEERKELLQAKRVVMDEAFEQAKQALCRTPAKDARAFLLAQTAQAANGDELLIVGKNNDGWFDESFLADLNAELSKLGKPANVRASAEKREGATGAILQSGGTEVFCTVESMLEGKRDEMETEIARILFDE